MDNVHINNSDEVIEFANNLSSEGRIDELKELLEKINNEINRFPLNERSEDNQLSLLKSKYEVESLIERNIVPEPITTQDETKKDKHIENLDLEKLIANKDKFLIACVVISVISAIGFFKFGLNFLFAFLPLFFFKRRKP
ncbi:MAG: hypothetical protein HN564_05910 [Flavobacteriales bacterium]|jgi:hypothetical protein|nr:hypothetical protein [Flavobacteriales bacterium]